MSTLEGKVAIVTGGGRGIGLATARALTRLGAKVTVFGRTAAPLDEAVKSGAAALAVAGDVASEADVKRLFAESRARLGPCAVLVNNAAVLEVDAIEQLSVERWRRVLDVNVTGAFLCTREALPAMKAAKWGRIVNVASISGSIGTPRLSAYNASKWALIGLTKCTTAECRETGVVCLCVSPGSTDTEMLKKTPFPPQMTPDEVASVISWCASGAPAAMQGTNVEVFG